MSKWDVYSINREYARFRQIVRGKVKQSLKKYLTHGEMIARHGKNTVKIPLPQIDLPKFKFGQQSSGGVGQGKGQIGDEVGKGEEQPGEGEAGNKPGEHDLEVEFSLEELAEILGEELELPKIKPKGDKTIKVKKYKSSGIARVGPEAMRNFKRSFKEALKRQISIGTYNPDNPIVIPIKADMRYRSWKEKFVEDNSAVIIYIMDVSGSMGDEQKEIVRTESFWIDTWLKSQYKNIETRFIIHDASAKEVDRDAFFRTRESGGTLISSALHLCAEIIEKDYPSSEWNIYPFHFSDGDNWSTDDTRLCLEILNDSILPRVNVFCYGQVESRYGSGQFYKDLLETYGEENEQVILSKIENKDAIMGSIKDFLGKGK